jgi:hypothetical protein
MTERESADRSTEPFRYSLGSLSLGLKEQDSKFFSAITRNQITAAAMEEQSLPYLSEHHIATRMTIAVVHLLKVVKIT